jgi:hypothetical protein
MPRLVHKQVTTIQIISVELTFAEDDGDTPSAPETSTIVRRRRRTSRELKDAQDNGPLDAEVIDSEDKP